MSSDAVAIRANGLGKCFQVYDRPQDRLKQSILPRLRRLTGGSAPTYFRELWAVHDVSFEIRKGETVGIVGRNGSGKSTLLQLLCGTLAPTVGTVETQGRVSALLELGAGFNPEFTGYENVYLNAAIVGVPRDEMATRMDRISAFSELGDFLDQPIKTYSSGMYARLAFAAAIHVDPEILIVDETLAVGDARFVAKCMRRIQEMKERGTSVLFVSHDVASVRTLCTRAIWLDRGRLVDQGDVFPVTGRYTEFMFSDDAAPPGVSLDSAAAVGERPPEAAAEPGGIESSPPDPTDPSATAAPTTSGSTPRPIAHWGSHRGLILSASVTDKSGVRRDVHYWGETLEVQIEVQIPPDIRRDGLGVAFSIKDLKGTDLIVSSTRDFDTLELPDRARFRLGFRFDNPLVSGKYLLVAAVERRQHSDIHYYEYLEGAHYFSSLSDTRLFGLFRPPIEQRILFQHD